MSFSKWKLKKTRLAILPLLGQERVEKNADDGREYWEVNAGDDACGECAEPSVNLGVEASRVHRERLNVGVVADCVVESAKSALLVKVVGVQAPERERRIQCDYGESGIGVFRSQSQEGGGHRHAPAFEGKGVGCHS